MCGIAGILALSDAPVCQVEIRGMTKALAHRGPDGTGEYFAGAIGLGHRRLAVLAPGPAARQPMSYAGGRYTIVHNGEIYNFLELRRALEGLGHSFATDSDTEVIAAAFAQWGEGCQERFNGMWAFAIWDAQERRLFMSRDRFGVKPLFYCQGERFFAFASEMKAFLHLPWFSTAFHMPAVVRAIVDPDALEATEHCLLAGLRRLRGGHCLSIGQHAEPRVRRWWSTIDHLTQPTHRFERQVEEFSGTFEDAVRLRMRSDIPIACTLSGGLDSSSIVATGARVQRAPSAGCDRLAGLANAFVASYPRTSHDEVDDALAVAKAAGVRAAIAEIEPGLLPDLFDEFIYQCEEVQSPHVGPWLLYREMSRAGIKVSLDGHGGDELLAGYASHVAFARDAATYPIPRMREATMLSATLRAMSGRLQQSSRVPEWAMVGRRFGSALKARVMKARGARAKGTPSQGLPWLRIAPLTWADESPDTREGGALPALTAHLYRDFHARALPTILRDFDRFSMAHGVEVRSPFLDWRLVCYCFSLPTRAVLGDGQTKRILREAMRGVLPERVRTRSRKVPYKSPLPEWWGAGLREMVLDVMSSRSFLAAEAWDGLALREVVENSPANEGFRDAHFVLRFVAAHRLIQVFRSGRIRHADAWR